MPVNFDAESGRYSIAISFDATEAVEGIFRVRPANLRPIDTPMEAPMSEALPFPFVPPSFSAEGTALPSKPKSFSSTPSSFSATAAANPTFTFQLPGTTFSNPIDDTLQRMAAELADAEERHERELIAQLLDGLVTRVEVEALHEKATAEFEQQILAQQSDIEAARDVAGARNWFQVRQVLAEHKTEIKRLKTQLQTEHDQQGHNLELLRGQLKVAPQMSAFRSLPLARAH